MNNDELCEEHNRGPHRPDRHGDCLGCEMAKSDLKNAERRAALAQIWDEAPTIDAGSWLTNGDGLPI